MPIHPLPVFEADADPRHRDGLTDQEIYEQLKPPDTIVVRFGRMKLVGEFPYSGEAKPGCGTKLVARTHRGTELCTMLTTTCENAGCSKSVTRQEMLDYIEASGGNDYPFHTKGRVLRIATVEDLNADSALQSDTSQFVKRCRELIEELMLDMKLIDVEPILGGELLTFYYMSEDRVDFRELVRLLATDFKTRIEMRQVGARDEARLVADYERCGQHCCCKNFLKVLKPVSMRSAKVQKATLDPLKISGRCGRLMCCLRYEDATYTELRKNLPRRKSRVGTSEGPGIVIDTKVLVQLALVRLEHDDREIAVPIEELMDPETCPKPGEKPIEPEFEETSDPLRGLTEEQAAERTDDQQRKRRRGRGRGRRRGGRSRGQQQDAYRKKAQGADASASGESRPQAADGSSQLSAQASGGSKKKRSRRRSRRRGGNKGPGKSGESET